MDLIETGNLINEIATSLIVLSIFVLSIGILFVYYRKIQYKWFFFSNLFQHIILISISYIGLSCSVFFFMQGKRNVAVPLSYVAWTSGLYGLIEMIKHLRNR